MEAIERIKDLLRIDTDYLFEMANLSNSTTGLAYLIWVSVAPENHKQEGFPRIKVSLTGNVHRGRGRDVFSVSVQDDPSILGGSSKVNYVEKKIPSYDLKKVFEWVKLNKEILTKYWKNEVDTLGLISNLKKLPQE